MNMIIIKPLILLLLAFAAGWMGSALINASGNAWIAAAINSVRGNPHGDCTAGPLLDVGERPASQAMSSAFDPSAPVTPARW